MLAKFGNLFSGFSKKVSFRASVPAEFLVSPRGLMVLALLLFQLPHPCSVGIRSHLHHRLCSKLNFVPTCMCMVVAAMV